MVSFGAIAFVVSIPASSEAEITLKKGYISKAKPKKGIVLYLHGCNGLFVRGVTKEWFRHFERSGYRVYAPDSFAEERPAKSCKRPFPKKRKIYAIRVGQTHRAIEEIRKKHPKKPIFVWGNSEGGNLAYRLKFEFSGVVSTAYSCGLGSRRVDLPQDVPLMVLMGNPLIDIHMKNELQSKGHTSLERLCEKALKPEKWNWEVFLDLGHLIPIWDKRVREAVNKIIPIKIKYVGQRPPPNPSLGRGYNFGPSARKALNSKYRKGKVHKAFAIGPKGSWGAQWDASNSLDATTMALFRCQNYTKRNRCALYQVNGHKVLGRRYSYVVQRVQRRLSELGFDAGAIDGLWGGKTKKALNEFRANKGYGQVEKLDEEVLKSLGLEGLIPLASK